MNRDDELLVSKNITQIVTKWIPGTVVLGTQYLIQIANTTNKNTMDVEWQCAIIYNSWHTCAASIPLINIQKYFDTHLRLNTQKAIIMYMQIIEGILQIGIMKVQNVWGFFFHVMSYLIIWIRS